MILTTLKSTRKVKKILKGEQTYLSVSAIVYMLISLPQAKLATTKSEYQQISDLFYILGKDTKEKMYDLDSYRETIHELLMMFDEIAPCNQYCIKQTIREVVDACK